MAVSSGFFNSVNHDRLYDAEQVSSLFDGIILDGVYQNFGEGFRVVANSEVNDSVIVKTGRAWFDHTWTYNDSDLVIQLDPPNSMLQRVDAIVIDVNREQGTRKNSVICVKGSLGKSTPPTLVNTTLHRQYPLAYVNMKAGSSSIISQANITNKIGSDECPVVTGVLDSLNLDMYYKQLEAEFNTWWDGIKDTLDEATATKLQNQINELKEQVTVNSDYGINPESYNKVETASGVYKYFYDQKPENASNPILDIVLPDGYFGLICPASTYNDGYISILDSENFVIQNIVYEKKVTSVTSVNYTKVVYGDFSKFPCVVVLQRLGHVLSGSYASSYKLDVIRIELSSDHVPSVTLASQSITQNYNSLYMTTVDTPAFYSDGSRGYIAYSKVGTGTNISYLGYRVSTEGQIINCVNSTLTKNGIYASSAYDMPLSAFMTIDQDYIYCDPREDDANRWLVDPTTFEIVHVVKYSTENFIDYWPCTEEKRRKIIRGNFDIAYSYIPNENLFQVFSGKDYTFSEMKISPMLGFANMDYSYVSPYNCSRITPVSDGYLCFLKATQNVASSTVAHILKMAYIKEKGIPVLKTILANTDSYDYTGVKDGDYGLISTNTILDVAEAITVVKNNYYIGPNKAIFTTRRGIRLNYKGIPSNYIQENGSVVSYATVRVFSREAQEPWDSYANVVIITY